MSEFQGWLFWLRCEVFSLICLARSFWLDLQWHEGVFFSKVVSVLQGFWSRGVQRFSWYISIPPAPPSPSFCHATPSTAETVKNFQTKKIKIPKEFQKSCEGDFVFGKTLKIYKICPNMWRSLKTLSHLQQSVRPPPSPSKVSEVIACCT